MFSVSDHKISYLAAWNGNYTDIIKFAHAGCYPVCPGVTHSAAPKRHVRLHYLPRWQPGRCTNLKPTSRSKDWQHAACAANQSDTSHVQSGVDKYKICPIPHQHLAVENAAYRAIKYPHVSNVSNNVPNEEYLGSCLVCPASTLIRPVVRRLQTISESFFTCQWQ